MTDATTLQSIAVELRRLAEAVEALARPAEPEPAAGADVREWYRRYVEQPRAAPPSRDDDLTAARAAGFTESRETLRELRRELAPASWQAPGRPGKENRSRQICHI